MIDDIYRKVDPEQPVPWWLVPMEPDYEAMVAAIPQWIINSGGSAFVPIALAKLMWRAGIGDNDE